MIEQSLGRPLEAIFASFDPVPVAAASVAQVHRATLAKDGAVVAVKVRRPDIAEKVALGVPVPAARQAGLRPAQRSRAKLGASAARE